MVRDVSRLIENRWSQMVSRCFLGPSRRTIEDSRVDRKTATRQWNLERLAFIYFRSRNLITKRIETMQYRIKSVSLVVLAVLALLVGATAQAGTISIVDFTNDATSGISNAKSYTHTIDPGNQTAATVNGVVFDQVPATGSSVIDVPALNYKHETAGGVLHNLSGGTTGVTGGVSDLMYDHVYNHGSLVGEDQTITLSGLTAGVTYDMRLYYRPWTAGDTLRVNNITCDEDGAGPLGSSQFVGEDDGDGTFASYLSYVYTAGSEGKLVISITPNPASGAHSWHTHGLTNEVVAVPEPGTLALLATGLLGLLAYAWRKRK